MADQHHPSRSTHQPPRGGCQLHRHWVSWVIVGLMLAALAMYILSDDESLAPQDADGQAVPAAP